MKPALLTDSGTVAGSSHFAITHGPTYDLEISFFTPIPLAWVQ